MAGRSKTTKQKKPGKVHRLILFLLKEDVTDWKLALKHLSGTTKVEPKMRPVPAALDPALGWDGEIFYRQTKQMLPGWKKDVLDPVAQSPISLEGNASTSGLLFLRIGKRILAFVFGGGRHMLDLQRVEPDFGVRVVINRVEPKKIKSLDLKQFEDQLMKRKDEATKETDLSEFGVDTRRDLLNALTGTPKNLAFAERIAGADSLLIIRRLQPAKDLQKVAKEVLAAYKEKPPKEFEWVMRIRPLNLKADIDAVLPALIKDLSTPQSSAVFDFPDWLSEDDCERFYYGSQKPGDDKARLLISHWFEAIRESGAPLDEAALKKKSVTVRRKDGEVVAFSPLELLAWHSEDKVKKRVTVLSSGHWFRVSKDFTKEVDDFVMDVTATPLPFSVPDAVGNQGKLEDKYLDAFAAKNPGVAVKFHLAKKFRVKGHEVEPCDVFVRGGYFGHVKIWSSSQAFSALMKQGGNSAEIIQREEMFRRDVASYLDAQPGKKGEIDASDFAASKYCVCFLLVRKERGAIPFFSKLSLYRTGERIIGRGFRVAYRQINVKAHS